MRNEKSPVRLATVSGPSGAGKSSYIRAVLEKHPGWYLVPSVTTRDPRAKDLPDEYRHVTSEEFASRVSEDGFAWTFEAHGHRYGTLLTDVLDAARNDRLSLMPIAPATVPRLRHALATHGAEPGSEMHVYCCAPNETELRDRHARRRARGDQVTDEEIDGRIAECRNWDSRAYASGIPYVFLPGDISIAEAAERIVNAIRHLGGRS